MREVHEMEPWVWVGTESGLGAGRERWGVGNWRGVDGDVCLEFGVWDCV